MIFRIVVRRILQAILVSFLVSTFSFFLVRALPGDLALRIAAGTYGYDLVSTAAANEVRRELKLDLPLPRALASWWLDLGRLHLGDSMVSRRPVISEVRHYLSYTIWLALCAMTVAWLLGPLLGAVGALSNGRWIDLTIRLSGMAIRAIPGFLVGILLIVVFSVDLNAFPAAGTDRNTSVALPAVTVALGLAAGLASVTRESVLDVVHSAYYAFARTKGLSAKDAFLRHAIHNAAVPVIAYSGIQMAFLIEGIVAVETLFAWPGIGHALVHAIFARDVLMIQGAVLAMALLFVALSALTDFALLIVDPRQR